jgi:hypothetical protein
VRITLAGKVPAHHIKRMFAPAGPRTLIEVNTA